MGRFNDKLASLTKKAAGQITFGGQAWVRVFIEPEYDIITDLMEIKASNMTLEEKVAKAKELARNAAYGAWSDASIEAEKKWGVKMDLDGLTADMDSVDWDALVTPETPEQ